jgi:hypothetical protein
VLVNESFFFFNIFISNYIVSGMYVDMSRISSVYVYMRGCVDAAKLACSEF